MIIKVPFPENEINHRDENIVAVMKCFTSNFQQKQARHNHRLLILML